MNKNKLESVDRYSRRKAMAESLNQIEAIATMRKKLEVLDEEIQKLNKEIDNLGNPKEEEVNENKLREQIINESKYHAAFEECYYVYWNDQFYSSSCTKDLVDKVVTAMKTKAKEK